MTKEASTHFFSRLESPTAQAQTSSAPAIVTNVVGRRSFISPHENLAPRASSLDVSWEFREHRASVFTYYLLQGLRGEGDLNHDGRITIDELFDYTSQWVSQETGQRPQQLLWIKRSLPYALAPVYRSQLHIGSNVIGKLKVAVGNFVWTQKKMRRRPLRLAGPHRGMGRR